MRKTTDEIRPTAAGGVMGKNLSSKWLQYLNLKFVHVHI